MLRSTTSAFTRVFNALWWYAADPGSTSSARGSRLCGAPSKGRCTASGTRGMQREALTSYGQGV